MTSMKQISRSLATVAAALALSGSAYGQGGDACGSIENHYGPFDYRGREGSKRIVEVNHFSFGVESLTKRMTGPFGADIGYTLRVFPNHYRALQALERLSEKEKADPPEAAQFTVECYYSRALRFVPDDHIVRLLYANYLVKHQRRADALTNIDYVAETTRENPVAQLNVGRMYLDLKEYDKALDQAHRLIAMGYDRKELRDGLVAAGRWVEPASAPAAASAASEPTP